MKGAGFSQGKTIERPGLDRYTKSLELPLELGRILEQESLDSKRSRDCHIRRAVVDEHGRLGSKAKALQEQVEYGRVRLADANLAGKQDSIELVEKRKAVARRREGLSRPVAQRIDGDPFTPQPAHDLQSFGEAAAEHLRPARAIRFDQLRLLRILSHQLSNSVRERLAGIKNSVPLGRADLGRAS